MMNIPDMQRKLTRVGNSLALILTRDLKEHLGITDTVDFQIKEGEIVLRMPLSFEEAKAMTSERYRKAYEELSK
jgi:antitoxin component of MazEF toxin-antitoxin module